MIADRRLPSQQACGLLLALQLFLAFSPKLLRAFPLRPTRPRASSRCRICKLAFLLFWLQNSHQNLSSHAMFIINSKLGNLTLTLVFYVTLFLALSVCSDAKGLHLQHRDHASLQRLIKKRAPPPPLVPVIGAGAAVPVSPSSSSASTTTATTSTTSSATQSTTSGTTSGTETTTSSSVSHLFMVQF